MHVCGEPADDVEHVADRRPGLTVIAVAHSQRAGLGDVAAVTIGEDGRDRGGGLAVAGDDGGLPRVAGTVDDVAELGPGLVDAYSLHARIIHVINVVKQEASCQAAGQAGRRAGRLDGRPAGGVMTCPVCTDGYFWVQVGLDASSPTGVGVEYACWDGLEVEPPEWSVQAASRRRLRAGGTARPCTPRSPRATPRRAPRP